MVHVCVWGDVGREKLKEREREIEKGKERVCSDKALAL